MEATKPKRKLTHWEKQWLRKMEAARSTLVCNGLLGDQSSREVKRKMAYYINKEAVACC